MAEHRRVDERTHEQDDDRRHLKRRGILAVAGAAVAGIVAKQTAEPVLAATFTLDTTNSVTTGTTTLQGATTFMPGQASPVPILTIDATTAGHAFIKGLIVKSTQEATALTVVGANGGTVDTTLRGGSIGIDVRGGNGAGTSPSVPGAVGITAIGGNGAGGGLPNVSGAHGIVATGGNTSTNPAPGVVAIGGNGVSATGGGASGSGVGGAGVSGTGGTKASGVIGTAGAGTAPGVKGINTTAGGIGMLGTSTGAAGAGVNGTTDIGKGVFGQATGKGNGVQGDSQDGNGVFGSTSGNGSVAGTIVAGVFGTSSTSYGIIGNTTAPGFSGLTAITGTAGVAALAATSTVPTAYAAYFTGPTVVQGDFAVVGGTKSAAVKDASGQHRLVYCVESPESWFEDVGEATLVNGAADVNLDGEFAAIIHTDSYHVFLTPHFAQGNGLAVTQRTPSGFQVREHNNGTASGTFSWRVMAKRKDIEGKRLAPFDLPKINRPDPAKLPKSLS